ncbi:hypothetical protein FD724_21590 [Nostoc sp. C057]|uniref:hypothetical protein n=1 Tax=Nostoc sp. C057 TaxID=2576903 RepID=UPI0015C36767|nr:hypothetical protein [Nostoc sp. C057]QLE50432.1 hypothetical protein FD724_21590 [Nostoc sp. C057]
MNIVKLILLAFPAFLLSMLLIVNPVNASSLKSLDATQVVTVTSTHQIPDLASPNLIQTSNPISDQVGCNCANCVQSKFQSLQGKLPSVGF